MFPGSNVEEELLLIWKSLGTPTEETWPGISKNKDFISACYPFYEPQPLSLLIPRYICVDDVVNYYCCKDWTKMALI